jgi:urea ABC transporter urea binding protein
MGQSPVSVGLLHSQSGPMSSAEKHVLSALVMAIEEINKLGGILGRPVRAIVEDGRSDARFFSDRAEKLVVSDKVSAIFGCFTSSSRKAVKPVVESHQSLLWYPVQYEGLEESSNIIYTGSCLNQQITPAVEWALDQGVRNVFLIGSDYVYPHTANGLIRTLLVQSGAQVVGESYHHLGGGEFQSVVKEIRDRAPDMVLSTISGSSNISFFREIDQTRKETRTPPVLSFSFSEVELAEVPSEAAGNYACWSYFDSIGTTANKQFVSRYRRRFGERAPISDPVVSAYTQVYLWREIAEAIGSYDPRAILENAPGTTVGGPAGEITIQENHHVRKHALIGEARNDGRFRVVWASESALEPKPWLGIEDLDIPTGEMVRDALARYPEVLNESLERGEEIARRGRVEDALQDRALRLRQLSQAVENSPVSVVITDQEGTITYANPEFCRLTGYSYEEVIGQNPRIIKSGKTPQSLYEELWSTILAGKVWHGEFLNKKRDGALYWELAVIAPLLDTNSNIISFIGVKVDITKRREAEELLTEANQQLEQHVKEIEALQTELREQAIRDPLTGLYNRRYLYEALERELHASVRSGRPLSVILLDIDHFKEINDRFGHSVGDDYLVALGKLLQQRARRSDIVCRYGGEEFLLVLPDCNSAAAVRLAEDLRRQAAQMGTDQADSVRATISLGVVSCPLKAIDCNEVIDMADHAMYQSKRDGRDRVTVWSGGSS